LFAEGVVGTHGQVDSPHPSVANLAKDLVGADVAAFQALGICQRDGRPSQHIRIAPRAAATRGSSYLLFRNVGLRLRAKSRVPAPEHFVQFAVENFRAGLQ
jgi:hypothetical protein